MLYNLGFILVIATSSLFTIFSLMGYTIGAWVAIPFLIGLSLCVIYEPTKGES